jgi:hypothetical protein
MKKNLKQASPCVFEYTYEYIKVSITKNSYEDYYMSMDGSTLCSICFITGFPFGWIETGPGDLMI